MKKLLIILILLVATFSDLKAQPYNGGEITWECLSNGKFRFTVKLYRECYTYGGGQNTQYGSTITIASNSPAGNITLHRVSIEDISPICNPDTSFSHIFCHIGSVGMSNASSNMGAKEMQIFTSDSIYPNGVMINGVPPLVGWSFYYNRCCRIPSTNLIGQSSWRLRAKMYPYNNQNTYPCFDSSPDFAEKPIAAFPTGSTLKYNHNAVDTDLDSLSYSWAPALLSTGSSAPYNIGYSYSNPFGGSITNVNSYTGEISITQNSQGAYLNVFKVQSYKCGVLVSEIYREIQTIFKSTGTNSPPNVAAPFKDSQGQYTLFIDTVIAGDVVCFNVSAIDFDFLPNGTPQTMSLEASGSQFGDLISSTTPPTMSTTSGCLNPPCAKLTPAPNHPNQPLSGQFGLQTTFSWQTDCSHLSTNMGCGTTSNVYNFLFKVFDDYCPVPGVNIKTVTIVVVPPPDFLPPSSVSVITDSLTGNNILNWNPIIDSLNLLRYYYIYSSTNCNGPFTILDSVFSITNSYTHTGANGNSYPTYYYIKTIWNCIGYKYSSPSDTVVPKFTDIGISKIISPIQNGVGDSVYVKIVNFGSDTISSCNVSYDFGGSLVITETWSGILLPCDSVDYTFTTPFNPPTANYILCVNTLLPNDQNTSNDQICLNVFANINNIKNYNFKLFQNIPNPTNKSTTINYFIPKSGKAIFKVVNIVGEIIYSKEYKSNQGKNIIELDISNFDSGVYYYSLEYEGVLKVRKMVVLK